MTLPYKLKPSSSAYIFFFSIPFGLLMLFIIMLVNEESFNIYLIAAAVITLAVLLLGISKRWIELTKEGITISTFSNKIFAKSGSVNQVSFKIDSDEIPKIIIFHETPNQVNPITLNIKPYKIKDLQFFAQYLINQCNAEVDDAVMEMSKGQMPSLFTLPPKY